MLPVRYSSAKACSSHLHRAGRLKVLYILGASMLVLVLLVASGCGDSTSPTELRDTLTVTTTSLEDGRWTLAYAVQLEASGGSSQNYRWSLEGVWGLPPGLTLSEGGEITGTPIGTGSRAWQLRVGVTDSEQQTATRNLSLRICPAPLRIPVGAVVSTETQGPDACGPFIPAGEDGEKYWVAIVLESPIADTAVTATLSVEAHGGEAVSAWRQSGARGTIPLHVPRSPQDSVRQQQQASPAHIRMFDELREALLAGRIGTRPLRLMSEGPKPNPPARRQFNVAGGCEVSPELIEGMLIAESEHVAIYQEWFQWAALEPADSASAQLMLDYYEAYGQVVIDDYFGGVSDFDGNGKIVVLISRKAYENYAAWVWYKDLMDPSDCPNSNNMELVYMRVQMVNSIPDGWYTALGLLVHEVQHISSIAYGLEARGLNPGWIEEGTAEIAGEMSSRLAMAATGGPSIDESIQRTCWPGPTGECGPEAAYVGLNIYRLYRYVSVRWLSTADAVRGADAYGGGWIFHRYLGDKYGNAAFFRAQNTALIRGPEAFPELTGGKTFADLMVDFAAALMLNLAGRESEITTYDFASIFSVDESPAGYPWPAVDTGFVSLVHSGPIRLTRVPLYIFTSNGTGVGISVNLDVSPSAKAPPGRLVILRAR